MKARLLSMALVIGTLTLAATGPPAYAAQDAYQESESAKTIDSIDAPTLDAATPATGPVSGTLLQFSAIHDMVADLPGPLTVACSHDAVIDRCAPIALKISEVMAYADHRVLGRASRLTINGYIDDSSDRTRPPDDALLGLNLQRSRVYRI